MTKREFKFILRVLVKLAKRKLKGFWKSYNTGIAACVFVLFTLGITMSLIEPASADTRVVEEVVYTPAYKTGTRVYEEVVLSTGDSLWTIAEQYIDRTNHDNARDFVRELTDVNNIQAPDYLQRGTTIIVPCYIWE